MAHANPIQIQKYLKGVDYPATREQLIENGKNLGADENVCASLEQLPDEDFQTPAEVSQAFKGPSSDDVQSARAEEAGEEPAAASQHGQQPEANEFLVQVMEDSLAKIELPVLALDNAGSDEVKAFAQSMIDEYGKLGQQIEKMALDMKVPFPKTVRREHASLIRAMKKLTGKEFDQRFMDENLAHLENDLKVFRHYAQEKDGGPMQTMAKAGVKLFEKHLKMVRELEGKTKR